MRLSVFVVGIFAAIASATNGIAKQHPLTGPLEQENRSSTFSALLDSLETMQSQYFQLWQGTWPLSIDWTAAVLGTYLAAALSSLSLSVEYAAEAEMENLINKYFSQVVSFYFGQDSFSLRTQAYDDMLWVVLGWIESIRFVKLHSSVRDTGWYGTQFIPAFAHRARVFYDLASRGWDTELCGGGMIWSPYLRPYKNAITNELFITASIHMYLYFPGDNNTSPFVAGLPARPHDPKYLGAAIDGYDWLASSNMTNSRGLYVDGFHIRSASRTKCDDRNEMVYTYNQGVLLSGLRGLWEATGATRYLDDAHTLIRSVVTATGWNTTDWAGLGRDGILEELCDAGGYCSQNGQTFKGIFFHHLTAFCAPLPDIALFEDSFAADELLVREHQHLCASYHPWIVRNARAAHATRDDDGKYGMWWGQHGRVAHLPAGADDIQNSAAPNDNVERDVNNRGRGRTVETQGGGLAVIRAMWELTFVK